MASGLYSGASGLALGVGLNKGVSGLWGGSSGLIAGFGGWTPLALFLAGEPGVWYDPSDMSTMFQDAAGTTPVTAAGQVVGLVLDKSKGLVLGPELVTNGGFETNITGWVSANLGTGATASWSSNYGGSLALPRIDASNNARAYQNITTVAGVWYQVSFEIKTADNVQLAVGTTNAGSETIAPTVITGGGTRSVVFLATATTHSISLRGSTNGVTAYVDNVTAKLIPGNHAYQATAASKPILAREPLGGRRNLLTYTEQFDNAAWIKVGGATVTPNTAIAPNGLQEMDTLTRVTSSSDRLEQTVTVPAGAKTFSIYVQAAATHNGTNSSISLVGTTAETTQFLATSTVQRVSVTLPPSDVSTSVILRIYPTTSSNAAPTGINIWGAQLETGSTATAYQRVVSSADVTEAGKPDLWFMLFDGTDDFLVTGTITPGVDKAQVFAGVRKLSDAAFQSIVETSVNVDANAGSLCIGVGTLTGDASRRTWASVVTGSTNLLGGAAPYASPDTKLLSGIYDIAQATTSQENVLRLNGAAQSLTFAGSSAGTGNFLAYPLYIGRRGGVSNPFNGRLYGLITRFGANLDAGKIAQAEAWLNSRTGAY